MYPFIEADMRFATALLVILLPATASAQRPARRAAPAAPAAAAVSNLRYTLTFDSSTAQRRQLQVEMRFDTRGNAPVLLAFPIWTPGAYEVSDFARNVLDFEATDGTKPLKWDKTDYTTWRVQPAGARTVTVRFGFLADSLDNAMAWARDDFLLVNGTNVFPHPVGQGFDFPATVTVRTQPGWLVVTSMHPAGAPNTYQEKSYHDLVDMPFFIGRVDLDSMQIAGKWTRLASYPAGQFQGEARRMLWDQMAKAIPAESAVFGETPWDTYSTMVIFDSSYGGGSALEHQASHVGIYNPQFMGTPILASITAHEIFHAWNVKRLRPADMVPYRYEQPQPTPWLWVSEGITDYYADLALVRPGIVDSAVFLNVTGGKIENVASVPPVALEDASLSTWIHPKDGTAYIYYPKGSLAGLLLDIQIRDASDNRRSLDDVLRELYRATYKHGRGFTGQDWWPAVSRAAGGRSFDEFYARYVDGRDPYPYASIFALAGIRYAVDTIRLPRLGISSASDSTGDHVTEVVPGSVAAAAGVQKGDVLVSIGEVQAQGSDWGAEFRAKYQSREGEDLPIVVRRNGQTLTLPAKVVLVAVPQTRLEFDPNAPPKAVKIREGLLRGGTAR
jgi:predicted metalloprotease with PDZ domain